MASVPSTPSDPRSPSRFHHFAPDATALVVGATGGIGAAVADLLDEEPGFALVLRTGRDTATKESTAGISLDLAADASIAAAAEAIRARTQRLDLVLICSGLLHDEQRDIHPEKRVSELRRAALQQQFEINAIGPALLAAALESLLPRRERCVWGTLSARVGSIGDNRLGGWYGYRASKAAQNMFTRTLAIELGRRHKGLACVALHPGTVATNLSAPFRSAAASGVMEPATAAGHLLDVVAGLGPEQTGGFFAWNGEAIPW
mgnify:CR=1 FL=1